MNDKDAEAVIALLRKVAADCVMPHFRKLDQSQVREKTGPLDQVTIADEKAEAAIADGLRALFPGVALVGEEAAASDPALIGGLARGAASFLIDPIDGTANYAAGLPLFGMMIALVEGDTPVAGFIHDPICDDTAVAIRGRGAFVVAKDASRQALRAAEPAPVRQSTAFVSWRFLKGEARMRALAGFSNLAGTWDYRCAAQQYRLLAAGHCHAMMFSRTMPWDHAAGSLIHAEAGGHAARLDGAPWRASDPPGGILLAPTEASWHELRDALLG